MPKRRLSLAAAIAAALSLPLSSGCAREPGSASPPGDTSGPSDPKPGVVDVATARRLIESGVRVVDVRTPQEFAAGHVPGALNIPHDEIARRAGEIGPPEEPVVIYCRSGRRSGVARDELRKLGYEQVYDFQRYDDWAAQARR